MLQNSPSVIKNVYCEIIGETHELNESDIRISDFYKQFVRLLKLQYLKYS